MFKELIVNIVDFFKILFGKEDFGVGDALSSLTDEDLDKSNKK